LKLPSRVFIPFAGLLVGRYYDPATGRFLSVDPLVDETGQPYAYTGDDPVNGVDHTGLIRMCIAQTGACAQGSSGLPQAAVCGSSRGGVAVATSIGAAAAFGGAKRMAKYGQNYDKADLAETLENNVGINDSVQIGPGRAAGKIVFQSEGTDIIQVVVDSAGYYRVLKMFPGMPPEYLSNDGLWIPETVINEARGTANYGVLQSSTHYTNTGFTPSNVEEAQTWFDELVAQQPARPSLVPEEHGSGTDPDGDDFIIPIEP
jgi:uncharacterized protein RhaS with RHS repeats